MNLGSWKIDDLITFSVNTHSTLGVESDADGVPSYRVYEDETTVPILTGVMAKLDDVNTTGFYSEQITLSAANGFEKGKSYNIRITASVGGSIGTTIRFLQIEAEVDSNTVSDKTGYSGVVTNTVVLTDASLTTSKLGTFALAKGTNITGFNDIAAGAAMTLTVGERSAIATEVESHLLNEGDSQMLINAIVGAIGNVNVDEAALVALIRTDLERVGGNLNTVITRLTNTRATNLDNLDVLLSSHSLLSADYATATSQSTIIANQGTITANQTTINNNIIAVGTDLDTANANIDLIKSNTDKLGTMLVLDGAVYQYTANSLELAPGGVVPPTVQEIVDGILDEVLTTHNISNSVGQALSAAGAAGDPLLGEVETGVNLREATRAILSFLLGLTSGGGTEEIIFRDINNTKNRLIMTVDNVSNRLVVARDLT